MKYYTKSIIVTALFLGALFAFNSSAYAGAKINEGGKSYCIIPAAIKKSQAGTSFGTAQSVSGLGPTDGISITTNAGNTGDTGAYVNYSISYDQSQTYKTTHTFTMHAGNQNYTLTAYSNQPTYYTLETVREERRYADSSAGSDNGINGPYVIASGSQVQNTYSRFLEHPRNPTISQNFGGGGNSLQCGGYGSFAYQSTSPNASNFDGTEYHITWHLVPHVDDTPPDTVSVDINANPTSIQSGNSSLLTWTVSGNPNSCTKSWTSGNSTSNGSQTVYPQATTTYTITCTTAGGASDSDSVTVNVNNNDSISVDIEAYPTSIQLGQSSVLTWTVSGNPNSCTKSWTSGNSTNNGNQTVYPQSTTVYTITCSTQGGASDSDSVIVGVSSNPITNYYLDVSLNATPHNVQPGNTVNVSYTISTNDTNVSCQNDFGAGTIHSSGNRQLQVNNSRSFQINCVADHTTDSASDYVTVDQDDDNEYFLVDTRQPSDISKSSARFNGRVTEGDNVYAFFVYSSTYTNPSCSGGNRVDVGTRDEGDNFNRLVTGLSANTTYWYRACGEKNGDIESGSVYQFTTKVGTVVVDPGPGGDYMNPTPGGVKNKEYPIVETLIPTNIGKNWAKLIGLYNANGCAAKTWFEYGPSPAVLSKSTDKVQQGNTYGTARSTVTNLIPGVRYYVRVNATNCKGTSYGNIVSFVIPVTKEKIYYSSTIKQHTVTTNVKTGIQYGAGTSILRLDITNDDDKVVLGEVYEYRVEWENLTATTLYNGKLQVKLPREIQFRNTTRGAYDQHTHSVYMPLGEIGPLVNDVAIIEVVTNNRAKIQDIVIVEATAAFDHPNTRAQVNAIDFDEDTVVSPNVYIQNGMFGIGWAGWILMIILAILIYLVARYHTLAVAHRKFGPMYDSRYRYDAPAPAPRDAHVPNTDSSREAPAGASTYVPYRPS